MAVNRGLLACCQKSFTACSVLVHHIGLVEESAVWYCLQVVSNKEQRHIRKKARRAAARAHNASDASKLHDPDALTTASLPPDAPAAPATGQESSKVRVLQALLLVCVVGGTVDDVLGYYCQ